MPGGDRLGIADIERRRSQPAGPQRGHKRIGVDQVAPAQIDQDRARPAGASA